ncbi:MAG: hypothetical protein R3E68_06780 [Burkholderiaceae bacterium]
MDPELEALMLQALSDPAQPALERASPTFLPRPPPRRERARRWATRHAVPDRIRPAVAAMVRKAAPRGCACSRTVKPETQSIQIGGIIGETK